MNIIVAVDEKWGIGKNNDLLFHVPEDMKYFRSMTSGKTVICGKNTLLSFPGGNPLPKRKHFVLTHGSLPENDQLVSVGSLDTLFEMIKDLPEEEVFVIGGESVYRQLLPYCKKAYVTKFFKTDPNATVFFPNLDEDPNYILSDPGERLLSQNGIEYAFQIYSNKKFK